MLQIIVTFFFAVIGWIIFRAETISDAVNYICKMFSMSLFDISGSLEHLKGPYLTKTIPALAVMILLEWMQRDKQHALQFAGTNIITCNVWFRYFLYLILSMITVGLAGTQSEFIYFQF